MNKGTKLLITAVLGTSLLFAACDTDRNKATLQNSADTGNTREGQHHDIPVDTAKKDSANNYSKGNADPTGHMEPEVHPKH